MKRLTAVPFLLCASSLASISQAQIPPSPSATQNIVTLNFSAAVLQTAEAQKELGTLQTKYAPRQAQLQALNTEVESLRKLAGSTNDKLSDSERAAREQSLDGKEKQLARQAEDFRNDSQTESQQIFQQIAQKLYTFLQTYSQQHNYSAVIERGSDTAPIIWYAASSMDITDQFIKAYNAQSGVTTPHSPTVPAHGSPSKTPKP